MNMVCSREKDVRGEGAETATLDESQKHREKNGSKAAMRGKGRATGKKSRGGGIVYNRKFSNVMSGYRGRSNFFRRRSRGRIKKKKT